MDRNGNTGSTSLRLYLHTSEAEVDALSEAICDLLIERGFNRDDSLTAVVACVPQAEDVKAWADGVETFVEAMNELAVNFAIPTPNPEEDR